MVENIRIDLKDEHEVKFNKIMEQFQMTTKTEVIKLFIEEGYKMLSDDFVFIQLNHEMYSEIHDLLQRPEIRRKIAIYSTEDLVNDSLRTRLLELREMKLSLTDWEVLTNLNEFDQKLATAIKEFEMTNNSGVEPKYLSEKLDVSLRRVKERLEHFYLTNYLERVKSHERGYLYHTPLK